MKIEIATDNDKEIWNAFLEKTEGGSFYHAFEWKKIFESSFGHQTSYLIAIDDNEVKGLLPLVLVNGMFFGAMAVSMPFLNYGGVCALNEEVERTLIKTAVDITKTHNAKYLELRAINKYTFNLPVKTHKVSMTIRLNPDPENIWNGFTTKLRTNIRRAAQNDLSIRIGGDEYLDEFYAIFTQHMRDLGTPIYKKSFFRNILKEFSGRIKIFLVFYHDKPIATAFNGYFKDTIEGLWESSLRKFRKLQPSYFLYWEMIKYGCEKGFKYFHLGRSSKESGSLDFKKKWNAFPQQLYWYYYLNKVEDLPQLNPENAKFNLAIKTWKRLPVWTTRIIGPPIAKGIP